MAEIRFAREDELEAVNRLRREVNDLHVSGRPYIFKPGFQEALRQYIYQIWADPAQEIVVAAQDGEIRGFAVLHEIRKPENPFMRERHFLDVDEFCVAAAYRRQGIATAMIGFIREWAQQKGFERLELNMWEFNQDALKCYEAVGFSTYRRYMEIDLGKRGKKA